jgi:hypothetical protein
VRNDDWFSVQRLVISKNDQGLASGNRLAARDQQPLTPDRLLTAFA